MIALIDIEKTKRLLEEYIDPYEIPGAIDAIMESLIESESQTIDIVRCGECKHCGESLLWPTEMVCNYHLGHTYHTEPERFCSHGERRTK